MNGWWIATGVLVLVFFWVLSIISVPERNDEEWRW